VSVVVARPDDDGDANRRAAVVFLFLFYLVPRVVRRRGAILKGLV
jgi:hypothetical protein